MERPVDERIENNFRYHAPSEQDVEAMKRIRETAKEFAYLLKDLCPESREKALAMTHLETVIFWANSSIARAGGVK